MPTIPDMKASHDWLRMLRMCAQLANPWWMPNPTAWVWRRPDGRPQGFGPIAAANPGLANLLWLSMDMGSPPREYSSAMNGLYQVVLQYSDGARLAGEPLLDMAALLPLHKFLEALPQVDGGGSNPMEQTYGLLKVLALRRL